MTTSESITDLSAALAKAQGAIRGALKDSENPFFKSHYADLAAVWEACRGPLAANGLSIVQFPSMEFRGEPEIYEWASKQGEKRIGVRVVCIVSVKTRLCHASGQWIEDTASAMLASGDPQAVGSATTYLRRYALAACVGVAPEDDDGEAASKAPSGAVRAAEPAVVPKGFDEWWADMAACADEGEAALKAAWTASSVPLREYVTKAKGAEWTALKARAKQVPA